MSQINDLHQEAMNFADEAIIANRRGNDLQAGLFFHFAFKQERAAAELVRHDLSAEPTRSVLYRSAASLAIDCQEFDEAEELIEVALSGRPPQELISELIQLREQVSSLRLANNVERDSVSTSAAPPQSRVPQSTNLQTIIARAHDGQPTAIAELYALYGDAVRRYCYVRLNDLEVAQDCVQEVFLRIWHGLRTYEYQGDVSFTAWMYTIVNHVLISYARKYESTQQMPLTPKLDIADMEHADTPRTIVDRLSLRNAINQLTPEQQQVITLKFFVGLSNIEIATALGRTEGAVKALQRRAINRLQQILNRHQALIVEQEIVEQELVEVFA